MKTTNSKAKLAALALVPVLGAAALAGSAFAAEGTSSMATTTAPSSWVGKIMRNFHHRKTHDNTQLATNLASVLGLSATDVKAKLDAGATPLSIITASGKNVADVEAQLKALRITNIKTKLDAKVAAGTMTQAEENTILTNLENGTDRGMRGMMGGRDDTQLANDLASVLGLTPTDVKAKLDAGQTPLSIITASGKNVTDVQAQLKALHIASVKTQLDAKVAAGTMTQAEENTILANMQNGTGFGRMGGFRGHMGRGFGGGHMMNWTSTSTQ